MLPMLGEGTAINAILPVDGEPYNVTCLSMGNPHCVTFVEERRRVPCRLRRSNRRGGQNLSETNQRWLRPSPKQNEIKLRVWERGCGETLACGTGTCAACPLHQSTAVFSGHWIDPLQDGGWYWDSATIPKSSSARGQRVLELFANWQQLDCSTHCGADPSDAGADSGHLMILRFHEDLTPRTVEAFAVSTNSGKWYGPKGPSHRWVRFSSSA